MLIFNAGVAVRIFEDPVIRPLAVAAAFGQWAQRAIYVTAIDDGTHGATTLHGRSLAVDLSVAQNAIAHLRELYAWLCDWLPGDFDVVLESDHVHVEFDVHRRARDAQKGP